MQGSRPMDTQKGTATRKGLIRQRKMALQQDVCTYFRHSHRLLNRDFAHRI